MRQLSSIYRRIVNRSFLLRVQDHGGTGSVVIMLHGLASSSRNWQYVIPLLKENYHCITIDLLGFGESPKPEWVEYSIDQHVRSIHRTIRSLKLTEPYILAGHSLGSLLACRYARRYASEIKKLLMISPPVYFHHSHYGRRKVRQKAGLYLRVYRFLRTHKRFTLGNMTQLSKIMPAMGSLQLTEETWLPFTKSLENCIETQTVITDIAEVTAPVDLLYGSRDQVIVTDNLKVVASMRQVRVHEVKGATHFVHTKMARAVQSAFNR